MPARRGQPLVSFRHCLWRSRVGRLYVETFRRLQRCPVGSAVDADASGISRGSGTADGLIGGARQPLTGGDFIDASTHLLLTGSDPIDGLSNCMDVAQYLVELRLIRDRGG
jgi:hypothetical protein